MSSRPSRVIPTVVACAGLALCAGCGGSGDEPGPGVPKATVDALVRELDLAEERLRVTRDDRKVGSCQDIESKSYPSIDALVSQIPDDTDPQVLEALEGGIARLRELTATECGDLAREIQQEEAESEPEPAPLPQETIPEAPPEEEPTPEETEEEAPKEDKPKKEKEKDNGGGGAAPPAADPTQPGQGGGAGAPSVDGDG